MCHTRYAEGWKQGLKLLQASEKGLQKEPQPLGFTGAPSRAQTAILRQVKKQDPSPHDLRETANPRGVPYFFPVYHPLDVEGQAGR
jgi:hypothetical protein